MRASSWTGAPDGADAANIAWRDRCVALVFADGWFFCRFGRGGSTGTEHETSELSSGVSAAGKGTLEGRVRSVSPPYQHGVIFIELRATALACLAAVSWATVSCLAGATCAIASHTHTFVTYHLASQAWHLWYWVAPLGWDLSPVTPGAPRHFAWQAWHLVTSTLISRRQAWHKLTSTVVLRGRRGTYGIGWRPWAGICRLWRPGRRATSAWQAWHLMTSTLISRGRRGTNSHLPSFCVAGVALMVLAGALGLGFVACDARGAAPLCVAGVALGDIHLDITWQAWHKLTSTVVLRGRRGTYGTGWRPWAGICRLWRPGRRATSAWQAWHLVTSTLISRGRRGTNSHLPSFCVAGVALMVLGGALGLEFVACDARGAAPLLRGRRGTNSHLPSFCVAGVALMVLGGALGLEFVACDARGAAPLLRGRRGTNSHLPSFCVAGVALMVLGGALGLGFVACDARGAVFAHVMFQHVRWSLRHVLFSDMFSAFSDMFATSLIYACFVCVLCSSMFDWQPATFVFYTSAARYRSSMSSSSTSSLTRSIFHTHLCHTHTTTYIHIHPHTYVPSYIRTLIHTYILLCLSFLPRPR